MCLRCWGIDTLLFTRVAAEICLETTLRDAFNGDFDIAVVSDAAASWDEENYKAMLRIVAQYFGRSTCNENEKFVRLNKVK